MKEIFCKIIEICERFAAWEGNIEIEMFDCLFYGDYLSLETGVAEWPEVSNSFVECKKLSNTAKYRSARELKTLPSGWKPN